MDSANVALNKFIVIVIANRNAIGAYASIIGRCKRWINISPCRLRHQLRGFPSLTSGVLWITWLSRE